MAWFSIASAVFSTVGTLRQGKDQANALKQNAYADYVNAENEREKARAEAARNRDQNQRSLAEIKTGYSGSGIQLAGSAIDVIADAAMQGELDARIIEHNGVMQSNKYMQSAANNMLAAKQVRQASYWNAAAGALSAAGKIYGGGMLASK